MLDEKKTQQKTQNQPSQTCSVFHTLNIIERERRKPIWPSRFTVLPLSLSLSLHPTLNEMYFYFSTLPSWAVSRTLCVQHTTYTMQGSPIFPPSARFMHEPPSQLFTHKVLIATTKMNKSILKPFSGSSSWAQHQKIKYKKKLFIISYLRFFIEELRCTSFLSDARARACWWIS